MGRPSSFTVLRKERALYRAGASHREVARSIGVSHSTLLAWLKRGEEAAEKFPDTMWPRFWRAVQEARSDPRLTVMKAQYDAWETKPILAWKFLETSGMLDDPEPPLDRGPTVIQLRFKDPPGPKRP
jgi:hypothetical protein